MTDTLRLVVYDVGTSETNFFSGECHGAFRRCPKKGTDPDLLLCAMQVAGFEYADDPLVTEANMFAFQALHNGTADLAVMTNAIMLDRYELVAFTGAVDKMCYYFTAPLQEPIVYTEFLLDTFPWIYYVYLALGIAAISTILTISQRESVRSMLVEWPLRLLAIVLRQPALDRFSRHARLSGFVAAIASLLPFTIFAIYFDLNIKLLLAVPFQRRPPVRNIDELTHALKHGGYEYAMTKGGLSPIEFATPKQAAALRALTERFVVYSDTDYNDLYQSISDRTRKQVSLAGDPWSMGHCAGVLLDNSGMKVFLDIKDEEIVPSVMAYTMRRELYKERERLNRALALVQPAAINFPLKYPETEFKYPLKLNANYNMTVRFAQYRPILVFFGAIYLGCILVLLVETVVHKMARWLRMWHTLNNV